MVIMKRFIAKHLKYSSLILIIGLILNLGAILVAFFWLNSNSITITSLQNRMMIYEQQINSLRELSDLREQSINTLFLLSSLNIPQTKYKIYAQYVQESMLIEDADNLTLENLITLMQQDLVITEQKIKDITIEQFAINKQIITLSRQEAVFLSIAVLIQILGLLLILSRDMFKRGES